MDIEKYIDTILINGIDHDHWFMTKQTMSDYYFPYFIATIVENYPIKHTSTQNYQRFYTHSFNSNNETKVLYPTQCESENTYRNTIIAEYLGLIKNDNRRYDQAVVTPAYLCLKQYIHEHDDIEKNREIIDHQIEKICLNVIPSSKYEEVKSVTIFPTIFLYKILIELYKKYGDSKLNYDEFSLFVIRSEKYEEWTKVIQLIDQYRKHSYDNKYEIKIKKILQHQSTNNVRFNSLLGSLQHIEYESWESYRIKGDKKSYQYLNAIVRMYENSEIRNETDKSKLLEFMRSEKFFKGVFDNVSLDLTLEPAEFKQLVVKEESFIQKLKKLAELYGEDGTTTVLNKVRLSSVQRAFRDKLIETYGQKCMLCDATNKELLMASHIKQASVCNIEEKADYQNGFLLCAIHDKLFDRLLITFNFYDGKIRISPVITEREKIIFSLDENYRLPSSFLTSERVQYLMWHNEQYFKKDENKE